MQPLQWEYRPDGLRAPALICAFKGWNDAADAASSAITFVAGALGARRFATIDPEEFYDFQSTRPQVKLVEGQREEDHTGHADGEHVPFRGQGRGIRG